MPPTFSPSRFLRSGHRLIADVGITFRDAEKLHVGILGCSLSDDMQAPGPRAQAPLYGLQGA